MTTKLDQLFDVLMKIQKDMGGVQSDIKTLYKRGEEDRDLSTDRHKENQIAMGDMRQATAQAIAELRRDTSQAMGKVEDAVREQGQKLDEHAAHVAAIQPQLQMSRTRLAYLASIGLLAITIVGWALQASAEWAVEHLLKMKFGG